MTIERKVNLKKRIQRFNYIINEIVELNEFIKASNELYLDNNFEIINGYNINNKYLNVLSNHLIIHAQKNIINLYKILYLKEDSSVFKIFNELVSLRRSPLLQNNLYYENFKSKYDELILFKDFIAKLCDFRNKFLAHSDIDYNFSRSFKYLIEFYIDNIIEIESIIFLLKGITKDLLKCFFKEFSDENIIIENDYILESKIVDNINRVKYLKSNESLELYKLLDYIKDVKEIQDIVMDRSLDDKTIVSKVKDILKKDEFLIDGKKHISYKY
ncbi:hypothetical protein EAH69_05260 [Faecalibacter macacae]|uniref:Uncharacterized protein n=1 Tax=Faecalibacter macacae TaxID=1859289 RepID=A0A3L9MEY3_9FLAO|nr:hypothetical protein EAH69_05260 [Faecalibacter macacae]